MRRATRQLEAVDHGPPEEVVSAEQVHCSGVLAGVPESAVVGRKGHAAVVAPAVISVLEIRSGEDQLLSLHGSGPRERAADCDAGVRIGRAAGDAVAEAEIAGAVLGNTAHPAIGGVIGAEGALVADGEGSAADGAQAVPADTGLRARGAELDGV